jgi:predicted DCC family thiol-disulfide oxidoreductase YuxK
MTGMTKEMTVIYNDTCPICAREVAGYKRITQGRGLDITYAGLSESDMARFGLSPRQAARRLHVLKDGRMYDGVPAFALVWDRIPGLTWLARFVRLPVIGWCAALVYDYILAPALFAMHRRRERLGKAVRRG